jgi:hypothetical protein
MYQVPLRHEENAINQEANRINRIENRACALLIDTWIADTILASLKIKI